MSTITKYLYQYGPLAVDSPDEYDTADGAIAAARTPGEPYALVERTYTWDDDVILFSSTDDWPPDFTDDFDSATKA